MMRRRRSQSLCPLPIRPVICRWDWQRFRSRGEPFRPGQLRANAVEGKLHLRVGGGLPPAKTVPCASQIACLLATAATGRAAPSPWMWEWPSNSTPRSSIIMPTHLRWAGEGQLSAVGITLPEVIVPTHLPATAIFSGKTKVMPERLPWLRKHQIPRPLN